LLIDKKAWK